ncbi:MAG: tyrosine-protein phosphatase [Bullifex sp.]
MKKLFTVILAAIILVSCASVKTPEVHEIHTTLQQEFLSGPYEMATIYAKGTAELSRPEPVIIGYGKDVIIISGQEYPVTDGNAAVYNLKTGESYIYDDITFRISEEAPRNLYIDGVTNVRDAGGWMTASGKRTKQGILYRSARLDDITEEGKAELRRLGIKTEADLREDGTDPGVLSYVNIPMKAGGGYLVNNIPYLPVFFELITDETKLPLIYHCSIGTDRTGMVTFLINALLGVGEEDLYRDYLFSNFAMIEGMRRARTIDEYIAYMDRFEGETLSERTENFLISVGVDEADITALKCLMLE